MLTWDYLLRRRPLNTIPLGKRVALCLATFMFGIDFGLIFVFGLRTLHGEPFIALVAVNAALAAAALGFRLAQPPRP